MQGLRKELPGNRWTNQGFCEGQKGSGSDVVRLLKSIVQLFGEKIFRCSPTTIMNWINEASAEVKMPEIINDIKEIEIGEGSFCKQNSAMTLASTESVF